MVKLICSDLDGTLVKYGEQKIRDEVFDLVNALMDKGIMFAPASGRQYNSLKNVFAPVADRCMFVCENGAIVTDSKGTVVGKTPIPREIVKAAADDFWNNSDGVGEVMFSGDNMAYVMSRGLALEQICNMIGNRYKIVNSIDDIEEDIVKVSLSVYEPDTEFFAPRFVDKWSCINAAVAGPTFIDCTLADKGTGIHHLCKALDVDPSEIVAFGDNYNDVGMLDAVGHPFIVNTAHRELLDRYPNHIDYPTEILRTILEDRF